MVQALESNGSTIQLLSPYFIFKIIIITYIIIFIIICIIDEFIPTTIICITVLVCPVTLCAELKALKKSVGYCPCEQRNFTKKFRKEVIFRAKISGGEELSSSKGYVI